MKDYEIVVTETVVIITRYNGVNKDVVIPEFICGKKVVSLQGQSTRRTFDDSFNLRVQQFPEVFKTLKSMPLLNLVRTSFIR